MKYLKVTFKGVRIFLELFFAFLFTYITIVLLGIAFCVGNEAHGNIPIYVRSNGVHTDICVPVKNDQIDWEQYFHIEDYEYIPNGNFLAIGWGDKGFYLDTPTWGELKVSTALNAMFLPSETAMHVEFIPDPKVSEYCVRTAISEENYEQLIDYILNSFDTQNGAFQLIPGKGYGMTDNFYEAKGHYQMFRTCNVWTNQGLKSAGIRTSLFSVLPEGNIRHLK